MNVCKFYILPLRIDINAAEVFQRFAIFWKLQENIKKLKITRVF